MRNLPESHKDKNIRNFSGKKEAKEACDWCVSEMWCVTLHGDPGTGKTHLAISLADGYEKVTKPGNCAYFLPLFEFFSEIRNAQLEGKSEYRIIEKYADMDFLILDDLGASKGTESQNDKIIDLLDRRYRGRKKTVITTNLSLDGIQETYGIRTMRRISEDGTEIELLKK